MENTTFFTIKKRTQETLDTVSYLLEPVLDHQFRYRAGQFLTFIFRHKNGELRRSYSLFTDPDFDKLPGILVKRITNGEISRYLHDNWKEGDMIEALPAMGRFTLPERRDRKPRDIFLFAAGSGISPLFAILKEVLLKEPQDKVHLFYSNHSIADTIFFQELEDLKAKYPHNLCVDYFFSDAKRLEKARLSRILIEQMVPERIQNDKKDALFFACGPYAYMQMIEIVLVTMGFDKTAVRKETFVIEKPAQPHYEPEDKSPRTVSIRFANTQFDLVVQYPETILETALKQGIPIPYSCKGGRCSSCFAKCIEGKVEMSYNEVLTEKDEKQGYVLTCTGHPVSKKVVLQF